MFLFRCTVICMYTLVSIINNTIQYNLGKIPLEHNSYIAILSNTIKLNLI